MPMDAAGRLDLMRKYGAIYGRFDSKRKNEKPMSLHEVHTYQYSSGWGGGEESSYLFLVPPNQ